MIRTGVVALAGVLVMALAACGAQNADDTAASGDGSVSDGAAGTCLEGTTDCVDTPQLNSDEPVAIDKTGVKQFRRDAKFYLGKTQADLNDTIRIGRIDGEQFALTEDYRVGRITVELDTLKGQDKPIVTSSTVELPDGPQTFKLKK